MRSQASIDAIISVIMILTICSIVGSIFIQNRSEIDARAEDFNSRQSCWAIRNAIISAQKNGMSVRVELPEKIGGEDYHIRFIEDNADINTERGFGCSLPSVVYNSTDGTNFTVYSKILVIKNVNGRIVV